MPLGQKYTKINGVKIKINIMKMTFRDDYFLVYTKKNTKEKDRGKIKI